MSRKLPALAILTFWCCTLLAVRIVRSDTFMYGFLSWNLFLAFLPVVASLIFVEAHDAKRPLPIQLTWLAVWLVFLPNAPYITTDFLHLRVRPPVPLWYDIALLLSFAAAGIVFGYVSLAHVQSVLQKRFGSGVSWLCAAAASMLSGFGIYLGRFLRWNSWEIVTDPTGLARDVLARVLNPWSYPRTVAVTLIYGGALLVGYVVFRTLSTTPPRSSPALPPPSA